MYVESDNNIYYIKEIIMFYKNFKLFKLGERREGRL